MMLVTSSLVLLASGYSSKLSFGLETVNSVVPSGHCFLNVAYVRLSMYGFCTSTSLLNSSPLSFKRAYVKRTFSPVFLARGSTMILSSGTPISRAMAAKTTASGSLKRPFGARVARVDKIRRQAVEVELRGVGGDARVEAAEAEDCVGGVEGHVHAVEVVDEGGVLVDLVGGFYGHDGVVLLVSMMDLHV
ncbi:LOW QUALITY PROTEIN: hypothetical protein MKX08_005076 [Trichoderma sp. CBMAI-0020]|nr:LOW QUALITY PROTEIN: hypothetical protein MKX08_005076 [Trichoderma sp. CBMAI-0020]